jgi:hypothetical protein
MITLPTLIELLIISLGVVLITGVSAWLSKFTLKITKNSDEQTIPYKIRRFTKLPPIAVFLLLCVLVVLAILDAQRFIAFTWLVVFSSVVLIQLVSLSLALLSEGSREVAVSSFEGKAARMLMVILSLVVKYAYKSFMFILKNMKGSRAGGQHDDRYRRQNLSPSHNHGNLGSDGASKKAGGIYH